MSDSPAQLRAAIRARDVGAIEASARALEHVDLYDALDMVTVVGELGDPRFAAWSERWIARVERERRLQPAAVAQVRSLMRQLPAQSDARAVTVALRSFAGPPRTWS